MTNPLTLPEIERLSELAEKATPEMYWWNSGVPDDAGVKMQFIAACDPQTIQRLCAEVVASREALAARGEGVPVAWVTPPRSANL